MDVPNRPFNLIRDPWLPLRRRSGGVEWVAPARIVDRIGDDPFVAFAWPRPDLNGAAHEFAIGLLSNTAAPADDEEWEDWWEAPPSPEVLAARFEAVAHAFDLDGPGPRFLQDLDPLDGAEDKEVAALLIDAPGAQTLRNNADLFVKRGGAPVLGRAAAAMALFALQAYAPSGGAGHRTSLRGGGPLTTLAVAGDTLWGRLWPNVETRESIRGRWPEPGGALPEDPAATFPWLGPTRTSNPKAGGRPTTASDVHPLQVYWGMPRRVRLNFEAAEGRRCALTGAEDAMVVATYRTRNHGVDYSAGFQHPLTPYYRQKAGAPLLPVHPRPGGMSYRYWPGTVTASGDKLREPAQAIRRANVQRRRALGEDVRFAAFGYDMDNMKARAWIEGEWPLPLGPEGEAREDFDDFIRRAVAGAETVARLLTGAAKSALNDRPRDAPGDYGFIAERFFRDTEAAFFEALDSATKAIGADDGRDPADPTVEVLEAWARDMFAPALALFDEYAPDDGLESRDMERHVRARFLLHLALGGRGKAGKALFEADLQIPAPESAKSRAR